MNFKAFSVSLWYKMTDFTSELQGLLTNGDCVASASIEILSTAGGNLLVTLDTQYGKAVVTGITVSMGSLCTNLFIWNNCDTGRYVNIVNAISLARFDN